MSAADAAVSVIVRTTVAPEREASLLRAVDSVLTQEGVSVRALVVVNGRGYRERVVARLAATPGVDIHVLERADHIAALVAGRRAVATGYFAFLDDDDLLLPGALATRLDLFARNPEADVVVTTGYRHACDEAHVHRPDVEGYAADPIGVLLERLWLPSCAGTFRSETVPLRFFEGLTPFMEWTDCALRLALERRIVFSAARTFLIGDTPGSLSKSLAQRRAAVAFLDKAARMALPRCSRPQLRRKRAAALHDAADACLAAGEHSAAWGYHLRSLAAPLGARYLGFTRHLLRAALAGAAPRGGEGVA